MLAFVHIPKTAGTTLHKILTHQYQSTYIHHDSAGPMDTALATKIKKQNPQVILGHFSVGLHHYLPQVRYITCLREPVARLNSHYHHARNDPTHYLHNPVVSGKLDLAAYISSGLSGELSNCMTRMLAGVDDFHHAEVNEQTLHVAKSNLESLFDGIIISEDFDNSLLITADHLKWKTPWYIRRKVGHYGTTPPMLDRRVRAVIEKYNQFDCELYAWAKEHSNTEAFLSPDLGDRTRSFQKNNLLRGKLIFCLREFRRRI